MTGCAAVHREQRAQVGTAEAQVRAHRVVPGAGQLLLYPGGISETEILLAYGGVHFASKMGQLAGNHFITLTSSLENLPALGKTVLWKGAQNIRFEMT